MTLLSRIDDTAFHGDESGWVSSSYYYTDLLIDRDLTRARWDCHECGPWGSMSPHLGQWLIGFPLVTDAALGDRRFAAYYAFDKSPDENVAMGRIPPTEMLTRGRRAVAVVGVLCCLLMFAVGYSAAGPAQGLIAAALLLMDPVFLIQATRIMTDAHYNVFLLGLLWLLVTAERAGLRAVMLRRPLRIATASGLIVGLAVSVKVTALFVGGATFLLAAGFALPPRTWLRSAGAFGLSAMIVLHGLNPTWWIFPRDLSPQLMASEIGRLYEGVRTHTLVMESPEEQFPRLSRVGMFPLSLLRWQRLVDSQVRPQEWKGNRFVTIHKRLFGTHAGVRGEWIFFVVGLAVAIRAAARHRRLTASTTETASLGLLLYFIANYVFLVALLRLDWNRYYLPTLVGIHLLSALGIVTVLSSAWALARRAHASRPE